MRLTKTGAASSDGALVAVDLAQAPARTIAAASSPAVALASCGSAAALLVVDERSQHGAFWFPQAASSAWEAPAAIALVILVILTALLATSVARLGAQRHRLQAQRDEALRERLERETRLAEAQHRIGNVLSVIFAMLGVQSRQLADPAARRAIEQAAGRVRVVAEVNHILNDLRSARARVDDLFVRAFVARCIEAAGAEDRVRCETAIDPIDLAPSLLAPLALIINECVSDALEHGFPAGARGVIAIRLEARGREQGARRLTITEDGSGPPGDLRSPEPHRAAVAFANAFAVQLGGSFRLEAGERGTRAALIF